MFVQLSSKQNTPVYVNPKRVAGVIRYAASNARIIFNGPTDEGSVIVTESVEDVMAKFREAETPAG